MKNAGNFDKRKNIKAEDILRPSGGYNQLKVYHLATLIHDITVRFVELYIPANSRTCDQMEQAARSGKQNIAEGSIDAATSARLEINLYNVARGSLEELKIDYMDYLRQHKERVWHKDHPLAQRFISMRIADKQHFRNFINQAEAEYNASSVSNRSIPLKSVLVANAVILLINTATFWLKRLIVFKMKNFIENGGFAEQMHHLRTGKTEKK